MSESVVVGIVSVLVGLIVCLRGYVALRIIISLLGAWAGFFLGAGVVAGVTDGGFLGTALAWVAAIVGAIVLGILAYAFYQVAVLLGMGSLGFTIATAVLTAIGVENAVALWVVGAVVAVVLIVLALALDLPAVLLVVLTALAGASIAFSGLLVLLGTVTLPDLAAGRPVDVPGLWGLAALGLAAVGLVVQLRGVRRDRMRAAWSTRAAPAR